MTDKLITHEEYWKEHNLPLITKICTEYTIWKLVPATYDPIMKQFRELNCGRARGRNIATLRNNRLEIPHPLPPKLIVMIGEYFVWYLEEKLSKVGKKE